MRESDGLEEAPRIRAAGAGEVKRRAVVDGGPRERKADGDVHPGLEPEHLHRPVALVVVGGPLLAEALLDRPGIAVSESVADLPEGERLLLLAHELGHVRLAHARKLKALYRQHIPGEVRKDITDAVAPALGAQAHAASHEHELQADAYGYTLARTLGFGLDNAFALLTRQGAQHSSATHPATARRLAQLRLLELRLAYEPGDGTDAQAPATAGSAR